MSVKVLVTGANGFTGSHLCKHLLQRGYHVRGLVRKTSDLSLLKGLDVELVYGNFVDPGSATELHQALKGVETVYHIAAAYRTEGVPNKYFWQVNVEGTRHLLQAALRAQAGRFVHCSTVGVQGDIKNPPATEEAPYAPGDVYQQSKLAGEKLARRFFEEHRLPGVVVRPVGIYGPGDRRFLKIFKFVNNGKFRMFGSGEVLYHMTYVDDLVAGITLAGEKPEALGQVFTIGGSEYTTLNELVARIARALGVPVPRKHFPVWPVWMAGWLCELVCKPLRIEPPLYRRRVDFFVKDRAFDISKARRLLGYHPQVDLDTGLKMTADWYRANGLLN
ncbi:MAG: NAD-dependent epimerase/dehydratase family protein [candidate division KSB1 bacterium]|nr:NAD-dependent epimerase/dehydratase family protein [candidate division KSB1 bacterium]MDZ7276002.1 NAD-dependent epimerase/dehydratase family protein [candidate division KSB1 bacterium]MDZ7285716.1 NAD-dependent epimerase/dehydratase family protein [candidate division KSB1 bacterium]MDZ7298748.1 NAD-dependent epimerase/dehydratase family protein [candidate division KSB1 bacterium]MDZ7305931.1 NAD-dependent epimerase/dehydratase family protein [candidate division KSB1 bacterium]